MSFEEATSTPCAPRPACPVCGRHYEDGHDADRQDQRTLCDGSVVTLAVARIAREQAAAELGQDVSRLRNYEIESALAQRLGGAWIVEGPCPFNGMFAASEGRSSA